MKVKSLFLTLWCLLLSGIVLTSCQKDEDIKLIDDGSTLTLPRTRAFILNEGAFQKNNAGIAFYAPNKDAAFVGDIYQAQNKKGLGDTGQDIVVYDNYMYVSVYGSQIVLKLNSAGVEQTRIAFSKADGQPRYIAAVDGKLYVTLSSGKVARLDAATLKIEDYVTVGKNPEWIIENGGKLLLVNSGFGKDSTLSVVDRKSFKVEKTIIVAKNPDKILHAAGKIIVQGYGPAYDYPVQVVDIASGQATDLANATHMCERDGIVYFVFSKTDWTTKQTTNTFFSYNAKTGTLDKNNFLKDAPAELTSKSVYMMSINPHNGDLYIGTSDYTTNGDVYRFDRNHKFVEKFDAGGISPRKAVFF